MSVHCDLCNRRFNTLQGYQMHCAAKHVVCRVCDDVFKDAVDELNHVVREHNGCELCNTAFDTSSQQLGHFMFVHRQEYCISCHKLFKCSAALWQASTIIFLLHSVLIRTALIRMSPVA